MTGPEGKPITKQTKLKGHINDFEMKFEKVDSCVQTGRARCQLSAAHGALAIKTFLDSMVVAENKISLKSCTQINQQLVVSGVVAENRQCDKNDHYLAPPSIRTQRSWNTLNHQSDWGANRRISLLGPMSFFGDLVCLSVCLFVPGWATGGWVGRPATLGDPLGGPPRDPPGGAQAPATHPRDPPPRRPLCSYRLLINMKINGAQEHRHCYYCWFFHFTYFFLIKAGFLETDLYHITIF